MGNDPASPVNGQIVKKNPDMREIFVALQGNEKALANIKIRPNDELPEDISKYRAMATAISKNQMGKYVLRVTESYSQGGENKSNTTEIEVDLVYDAARNKY